MKIPPTPAKLLLLPAAILLCLLGVQACGTMGGPSGIGKSSFAHSLLELSAEKHVRIPVGKQRFAQALKKYALPNGYITEYCSKPGDCEQIKPKTIDDVLGKLKTNKATQSQRLESGSGDELGTDAIHVSQRVAFASKDKLEGFLTAVSKD